MQKFNKTLWAEKLAPILQMWKNIYSESTMENIKSLAKKISSKDPMTLYIKSEGNQLYDLTMKVQICLNDINNALNKNYINIKFLFHPFYTMLHRLLLHRINVSTTQPHHHLFFLLYYLSLIMSNLAIILCCPASNILILVT